MTLSGACQTRTRFSALCCIQGTGAGGDYHKARELRANLAWSWRDSYGHGETPALQKPQDSRRMAALARQCAYFFK